MVGTRLLKLIAATAALFVAAVGQAAPASAVTFKFSQSTGWILGTATTDPGFPVAGRPNSTVSGVEFFQPSINPDPTLHLGDNLPPANAFTTIGWGCTVGSALTCAAPDNTITVLDPMLNDSRSSLRVTGLGGTYEVGVDDFVNISLLEHRNHVITGRTLHDVRVDSNLRIGTTGPFSDPDSIVVTFQETLNQQFLANCVTNHTGTSTPCEDMFTFDFGSFQPQTFTHQGQQFQLEFRIANLNNAFFEFDPNTGIGTLFTAENVTSSINVQMKITAICSGSIGDVVWHDQNHNGIQDAGEPGIDGVTVQLKTTGGALLATTVTGSGPLGQHGFYQFTGLCAGDYKVEVDETTLPAGFTPTDAGAPGSTTANDSNGSPALVTLPLNNSSDQTIDFGYETPCTGSIGNFLWHDTNRNGIQDAGEPGIDDVTVILKDGDGNQIGTTVTGPNGFYQFTGLCAGHYTVEVDGTTLPAGFTPTTPNAPGSTTANDSSTSPVGVVLPTDTSTDDTVDLGFQSPCAGAIGDRIWLDLNGNGIQDAGEPGIQGAKVFLTLKNSNAVLQSTTTDTDGLYKFTGLCAGDYTVHVDDTVAPLSTLVQTTTNAPGSTTANDSNGNPADVTLTNDATDLTIDFGYKSKCTGKIGDFVWKDTCGNGIQSYGEAGIPGIQLKLKLADNTVIATTTTDAYGKYLFTGLCAGSYIVEIVPSTVPYGYVPTTSNAPGSTTSNDSNGSPAAVTLPANNTVNLTIDFGFKKGVTYKTYTQGGWGSDPNGNNPGQLLKYKFSYVYPGGYVKIGTTYKYLKFTSAYAIQKFLPATGTANKLTGYATNPTSSPAGVFAGQVLALKLNVDFSNKGILTPGLANLKLVSGPLQGKTVNQVLTLAMNVLGGDLSGLPAGLTIAGLNDIVTKINENFDNGTVNNGFLI
jgi:hypothetical protein